jgi:hypothetical protein
MYGQHDQSKHAPQSRKGVPFGIDLEGKRFSDSARKEFTEKANTFQDVRQEALWQAQRELGIAPTNDSRRRLFTEAYLGNDESPEGLAMKAKIDASLASNADYQKAKAELEANFIFRDAMNLTDANGVRFGDRWKKADSFDELPADYLIRMGRGGFSKEVDTAIFNEDVDFFRRGSKAGDMAITEQAKGVRVTPEEAIEVSSNDFRSAAAQAETVIIMPQDKLNQVLSSGRIKTVHETGKSGVGSNRPEYMEHRQIYESAAFGYDDATPVEARPVSGILKLGGQLPTDALGIYGGKRATEIVLKPETKERTTWTQGDSLNSFGTAVALDTQIFSAGPVARDAAVYRKATGQNYFADNKYNSGSLLEAQVHGGIKTSDIAQVRFFSPPSASAIAKLEAQGIPYEVIETGAN